MEKKKASNKKILRLTILVIIVAIASAFFIYASVYYKADDDVYIGFNSGWNSNKKYISCGNYQSSTGYIFYPGAKVDAYAYVPYLTKVAEENEMFCAIIKPPFHLAILNVNAANNVIEKNPQIDEWIIGGHSLGGVVAAQYSQKNIDKIKGLVLLASYPNVDLSETDLQVLSVTAANDKVLNWDAYENAKKYLPENTQFININGGNHAQFGSYGEQKGDGAAKIPASEQLKFTIDSTVLFIQSIL